MTRPEILVDRVQNEISPDGAVERDSVAVWQVPVPDTSKNEWISQPQDLESNVISF